MKTFESFQDWYLKQTASHRRLINKLRKLVEEIAPNLNESSKWSNGVWLKGNLPITYIHTEADNLQFGFFAGATLTDPRKILSGSGKFIRHIRIESSKDINEKELAAMIRKAYKAPPYK